MIIEHPISLAFPADAAAVAALSREAVEHGLSWRWTERRVLRCIRDETTNVAVARRSGAVVGFAIMKYGDEEAHIVLFAVNASERRRGLGSALLAWLEATARVAGIGSIRLEARAGNAEARSFYLRRGFEEAGSSVGYYEGLEDAVRMIKKV